MRTESRLYVKELPNGARVIALPMPRATYVAFAVGMCVGSRHDPPDGHGTAHFLEHMLSMLTKKRPRTNLLLRDLDALGGESNMYTCKDYTMLTMNVIPPDLSRATELIFDIVQNSHWNSELFAIEKRNIISELSENEDNPTERTDRALNAILFEDDALAHKIEGTARSVAGISNSVLKAFRNAHYHGGNLVVCVAGAISRKDVREIIEPYAREFVGGSRTAILPATPGSQTEPRVVADHKHLQQLWFELGFAFEKMDAREILVLDVLMSMLGDGAWSSHLFLKMRQQEGYAYDASVSTEVFQDIGVATISGSINRRNDKEAVRKLFSILRRMKERVSSDKLQFFKDYTCKRLMLNEDGSASWFANDALDECAHGHAILTPTEQIKGVQSVTAKEFLDTTRKIFDFSRANLALLGPCRSPNVYRRIIEEFL